MSPLEEELGEFIYIYIYIYIYVSVCVCVRVCAHAHTRTHTHEPAYSGFKDIEYVHILLVVEGLGKYRHIVEIGKYNNWYINVC